MIKNRLSILLAERNITANKLASDTGIARSTLTKLKNNDSKMIQFSTINTLCNYFKITPKELFDFLPENASDYSEKDKLKVELTELRNKINDLLTQQKS